MSRLRFFWRFLDICRLVAYDVCRFQHWSLSTFVAIDVCRYRRLSLSTFVVLMFVALSTDLEDVDPGEDEDDEGADPGAALPIRLVLTFTSTRPRYVACQGILKCFKNNNKKNALMIQCCGADIIYFRLRLHLWP